MSTPTESQRRLDVDLGARSYPIYIGSGLIDRADLFAAHVRSRQVLIVTNEVIGPLYLNRVYAALDGFETADVVLPDGERYKNLDILKLIFDTLLHNRFDRSCTLVALGGGVVGDMAGFAAACYQRGVDFIQVPTTLLAQVDSSVGGKTGVNHPLGKNMIGAFHQPRAVVIDTEVLDTLPEREFSSGLAEVIKYGLINDLEFFTWLENHMGDLRVRSPALLAHAIEQACRDKAQVVAADEHEVGQRALLNLGHTFGHAIEVGLGYGTWLHGEAVAAGLCMAGAMSQRLDWLTQADLERIHALVEAANLPVRPPDQLSATTLRKHMMVDKKNRAGCLRLVLLKGIGDACLCDDYDPQVLEAILGRF